MALTQPPPLHPAEFSPEIIDVLKELLHVYCVDHVHDPFAGRGVRLGKLCDEMGITFTGTDIERYKEADPRVQLGDSTKWHTYPWGEYTIVTSPVYFNRISTDYVNGPTAKTKTNGRRAYGISLGRALDRANLARLARHADEFYAAHAKVAANWKGRAIVNVDLPMANAWLYTLHTVGYGHIQTFKVDTRRYRGPANSDKRPECEIVLVATR